MEKTEEKKFIPTKTAIKGLITGFVSYGIIIGFLLFIITIVFNNAINNLSSVNHNILSFSLPLLFAFILYFVIHTICRISTLDLFKKCKIKSEEIKQVSQKMNLFFLICIIIFVILCNSLLILNLSNQRKSIDLVAEQYKQVFSDNFTDNLTTKMIADYEEEKNRTIASSIITQLSLVISFFSLIPYQKKMILEYNEVKQ